MKKCVITEGGKEGKKGKAEEGGKEKCLRMKGEEERVRQRRENKLTYGEGNKEKKERRRKEGKKSVWEWIMRKKEESKGRKIS